MRTLDLTTLRSFAAVAETGGVTRAARMLNLTQSAVSMQLKRLEEMLGLQLLERAGRGVALTQAGEQLLGYAQRMVALNDEIYARLTDDAFEGELVLGVPKDIVYPAVPRILRRFHAEFPRMRVHLRASNTVTLREDHRRGDTDMILTTEEQAGPGGEVLAEAPLRWFGAPGGVAFRKRPLPLAQARPCVFRPTVLRRLKEEGLDWESAVETDSDRGVEATVSADLGVTALLEGHAPPQLEALDPGLLPDLGRIRINLYTGGPASAPAEALARMIRQAYAALGTGPDGGVPESALAATPMPAAEMAGGSA
ncbi:LysR family transcriptional regulator [Roseivivax isoporae]|uniref:LysR family transcriptional regulator n=1 Tax=Roseivivax isoporae LMG 25204 TaxID=1449351 RepID=X7FAV2_9RHOB|nr:LysR family transcriptional regulator [Roseivivax isoporae]ETX29219.1 LysR family transcriptional regulator [Roseivivax isoporae LMG 25204]